MELMMGGKTSRNKGSGYERKIAKVLTEWWGEKFFRTPLSGGHQDMSQEMNVAGDIITKDVNFPFHLELKKHEGWCLEQVLISPKQGKIGDWFRQAKSDCKPGKIPFLIFSKNYFPDFFLFERESVESIHTLRRQSVAIFKEVLYNVPDVFIIPKKGMAIGLLDSFLDNISKEAILEAGVLGCQSMISNASSVVKSRNGSIKSLNVPRRLKKRVAKKKKNVK